MLYENGNTLGNNGLQTKAQIEAANAIKVGSKVRLTDDYKLALSKAQLRTPIDDLVGEVVDGGLPNRVYTVEFEGGKARRVIHASQIELVKE